jgi:carbon-monoxide dehydrogenase medium subunit
VTPRVFEYFAPKSVKEAITLLTKKEDAKVLAGGQSLLALMKLRLASPKYLVDINGLTELDYIRPLKNGGIAMGALTRHDSIEHSNVIRSRCYVLAEAASRIGDQQIRNRGTLAGSICHADPAADLLPAIVALDAEIVAVGPKGQRVIPAKDFFVDFFTTALKQNEVVTEVRIPAFPPRTGSAYIKFSRREGDFAIVGVAAVVTVDPRGVCRNVAIGLGAVAPTPLRARASERLLVGKRLDEDLILKAAEKGPEGANPPSDIHGSAEYRLEMIKVFVKRTLKLALSRIKEGK